MKQKPTKKLKCLPAESPYRKSDTWGKFKIYEDFPGESRGKKLFQCPNCLQWMPRNTIHTCYDAKAIDASIASHDAKTTSIVPKLPKTWGEMRMVKPRNRSVKPADRLDVIHSHINPLWILQVVVQKAIHLNHNLIKRVK